MFRAGLWCVVALMVGGCLEATTRSVPRRFRRRSASLSKKYLSAMALLLEPLLRRTEDGSLSTC